MGKRFKLSIIIPYYNAKEYTDELLRILAPQITHAVEVIVIDDGSAEPYKPDYAWCRVVRKENGGCASARNKGMDLTSGEYISFIDADDIVPDYFISKLLSVIDEEDADVIDFSWKSLTTEGAQHNKKLVTKYDRLKNPSVCTRAFKRSFIGDTRFNEKKDSTEDEDFSRKLGYLDPEAQIKRTAITDYMYFYRTAVSNSKIKRFKKGLMKTKRVTYYYPHVTADMTWLLDEIKKEDELNEVWLLTDQNDIPELRRYCQISKPIHMWTHYLKGTPYNNVEIITPPIKTQVVMYCEFANKVGGISTFIYNWCQQMKERYDILFLYDVMDPAQIARLMEVVPVLKNDPTKEIACDAIILNRLTDNIPPNVSYKKSIQICHACVQSSYRIPTDRDFLVNVSQAAKDTWGEECSKGIVINNMPYKDDQEILYLVSATRVAAKDKGSNDNRMRKLATMMTDAGIKYLWLNFSDKVLDNMPSGFVNMPPTLNVQGYMRKADYVVQLSDREACSMVILEALTNNCAVLATPFASLFEEGFVDGVTGHIIPFDMEFDITKILTVPKFNFAFDTQKRIDQWSKLLDATVAIKEKNTTEKKIVRVRAEKDYYDKALKQYIKKGKELFFEKSRAEIVAAKGCIKILG